MLIEELKRYPNIDIDKELLNYSLFERVDILDKVLFGNPGNAYLHGTLEEKYKLLRNIYNKRIIC